MKETWDHPSAIMSPQHSAMEEAILQRLHIKRIGPVITDKSFAVQSTTPDFYFPEQGIAIYLDGPVHRGKEDRDEQLRELLAKRYHLRVISISYEKFTMKELERIFKEILEALQ